MNGNRIKHNRHLNFFMPAASNTKKSDDMSEDTLLEQKFGKQDPFRVPKNYFSDFEKKLLENMPVSASAKSPLSGRLRLWLWGAVSTAAVACGVVFFASKQASDDAAINGNAAATTASVQEQDDIDYIIDEVSDYAMLDNSDLYSYVAGD